MTNNKMMVAVVATMAMGGMAQAAPDADELARRGAYAQQIADNMAAAFQRVDDHWQVNGTEGHGCADDLRSLAHEDVSEQQKVTLAAPFPDAAAWPKGSLKPGQVTIGSLRAQCKFITAAWGPKAFISLLGNVQGFAKDFQAGGDPMTPLGLVRQCKDLYADLLAAGLPASTKLAGRPVQNEFVGTLDEAKAVCDDAEKHVKTILEPLLAPYKKVLKNDKLKMMLDTYPYGYILPGGGMQSDDAGKLAKANAWFYDLSASDGSIQCLNGQIHTVRRFAFDGSGKLLKTTEKQYCGEPPASAFR